MKVFTTNFNTEKNKKTGASPVWIMKCPFPNTGTAYLSDKVFSVASWDGGITADNLVKNWGIVDEDISGAMSATKISDFSMNLLNRQGVPNIDTILWDEANLIEVTTCGLYLWFIGLNPATDPPVLMWSGNIIDFEKNNELVYNVRMVDESLKIDKYPGRILSLADYPNASLDDVGKQMNILYGAIEKVPALRLDVGKKTTLVSAIDDNDTETIPSQLKSEQLR